MRLRELALMMTIALSPVLARADGTQDRYRASYRHEVQAKYADALADIDGLAKEQRKTYTYHLRRGWLLYLLGRYWDSIESYRAAVDLHPRAVEPRLGLMLPTMALKLWLDVIKTGNGVTKLDPQNYTANSRMAWANYSLGRYSEAASLYRKVLSAYPSDVEMRTGLGWSLLKQGQTSAARSEFEAVLTVAPDHTIAKQGLAATR